MEKPVQLPTQLSLAIDEAVDAFVAENTETRTHKRWQDADIWIIYRAEKAEGAEPAVLTRRVTIGAWASPDDEELVFMPDIMMLKANGGRYTLTPEQRKEKTQNLSVFNLRWRLFKQQSKERLEKEKRKIKDEILELIKSAWDIANGFSVKDTTELIP